MKAFEYLVAEELGPALAELANGNATLKAGGVDLLDLMKERIATPDVVLSIADLDSPFPPLQIRGRVVEIITGEAAVDGFAEVTKKYTGNEPANRPPAADRVVYRIEALSVVAPKE